MHGENPQSLRIVLVTKRSLHGSTPMRLTTEFYSDNPVLDTQGKIHIPSQEYKVLTLFTKRDSGVRWSCVKETRIGDFSVKKGSLSGRKAFLSRGSSTVKRFRVSWQVSVRNGHPQACNNGRGRLTWGYLLSGHIAEALSKRKRWGTI